jgi:hypothetical protein
MAMGRQFLPPEEADSWGEFHARLEFESANADVPPTARWWAGFGSLFGVMLFTCVDAIADRHWWLWLGWLALLGVLLVMAGRAVARADRRQARAAELGRLYDAWTDHLERHSPTTL